MAPAVSTEPSAAAAPDSAFYRTQRTARSSVEKSSWWMFAVPKSTAKLAVGGFARVVADQKRAAGPGNKTGGSRGATSRD